MEIKQKMFWVHALCWDDCFMVDLINLIFGNRFFNNTWLFGPFFMLAGFSDRFYSPPGHFGDLKLGNFEYTINWQSEKLGIAVSEILQHECVVEEFKNGRNSLIIENQEKDWVVRRFEKKIALFGGVQCPAIVWKLIKSRRENDDLSKDERITFYSKYLVTCYKRNLSPPLSRSRL